MTIVYMFVAICLTAMWLLVGGNWIAAPFIASLGVFSVALIKIALSDSEPRS